MGCGGADEIRGKGGNDNLDEDDGGACAGGGPLRPDIIDGGLGLHTATYGGHTTGVWVDLDGAFGDDGAAGEGDSVLNIEFLYGSSYNDVLIGSAFNDYINGGYGNDTIYGLDGADTLLGDAGNDRLYGLAGADALNGGTGTDHCEVGAGGSSATACES